MGFELAEVEAAPDDVATVLMLGDSTVMAYPPGHALYDYLEKALENEDTAAPEVRVHSIAAQGMTPGNVYLALDGVMRAKPDVVTMALNLGVIRNYLPPVLRRPEPRIKSSDYPGLDLLPADFSYRHMDRVLDDAGKPLGGKLSFDAENRKPWKGEPPAPEPPTFRPDDVTKEVGALIVGEQKDNVWPLVSPHRRDEQERGPDHHQQHRQPADSKVDHGLISRMTGALACNCAFRFVTNSG